MLILEQIPNLNFIPNLFYKFYINFIIYGLLFWTFLTIMGIFFVENEYVSSNLCYQIKREGLSVKGQSPACLWSHQ